MTCNNSLPTRSKSLKIFKKLIHDRELQFWKVLEKTSLVPLVISITPSCYGKEYHLLITKRYPFTLGEWMQKHPQDQTYLQALPKLMHKLHKRGIIHGDLHLDNIVINPETQDMRLIDFDGSGWISELGQESLSKNEFCWGHTFSSRESMLNYEKNAIYYEDMPEDMKKHHINSQKIKNKNNQDYECNIDVPHKIVKPPLFDTYQLLCDDVYF